jgi:hypothetical protein
VNESTLPTGQAGSQEQTIEEPQTSDISHQTSVIQKVKVCKSHVWFDESKFDTIRINYIKLYRFPIAINGPR